MSKVEIVFNASGRQAEAAAQGLTEQITGMGNASAKATAKTTRGAHLAADSYKGMQRDLSSAKKELEALAVGSDVFEEQAAKVGVLEQNLQAAKNEIRSAVDSGKKFDDVGQAVETAAGSLSTLQNNLRQATSELNKLEPGTREFEQQGKAVSKLAGEVDEARQAVDQFTAGSSKIKAVGTSAQQSVNSVGALRTKLRDARQALEGLEPSTVEFRKQASEVKKLTKSLNEAERELKEFTGEAQQVRSVTGSISKMEQELKSANNQLKQLPLGTKEFRKQKQEVDRLATSLKGAKAGFGNAAKGAAGGASVVKNFTSELVSLAASLVGINQIVGAIQEGQQRAVVRRDQTIDRNVEFEQVLSSDALANITVDERQLIRPLAALIARREGADASEVAQALGILRSKGATDLDEAAKFLVEGIRAFPGKIESALSVASGSFIVADGTGNRNAQENIGSISAAASQSQSKSAQGFSDAFSAQIVAGVQTFGQTLEQSLEDAVIFSKLEPKSEAEAASALKAFRNQLETLIPELEFENAEGQQIGVTQEKRDLFIATPLPERANLLQNDEELREQFKARLTDGGRDAIKRFVNLAPSDRNLIEAIQDSIQGEAEAAKNLAQLQSDAAEQASTLISQGKQNAEKDFLLLTKNADAAAAGFATRAIDDFKSQFRTGIFGGALGGLEDLGFAAQNIFEQGSPLNSEDDQGTIEGVLQRLDSIRQTGSSEEKEFARRQSAIIKEAVERAREQNETINSGLDAANAILKPSEIGFQTRKQRVEARRRPQPIQDNPDADAAPAPVNAKPAQRQPNAVPVAALEPPTVNVASPVVNVTTPASEPMIPAISVAAAEVVPQVILEQSVPVVNIAVPEQAETAVAEVVLPVLPTLPQSTVAPAFEPITDDPLLAANQPTEFQLNREAREAERYEQQRAFNETLVARLDVLIGTNQEGFQAVTPPRVQDVQMLPGDPTEQPTPSGSLA